MIEEENGKVLISKQGLEDLQKRLDFLRTVKRQEISEKIKQAIAFGDLSENAEYDAAKQEQAFIESEIAELEGVLARTELIDEHLVETDKVNVGCKVTLKNVETKEKVIYYITGPMEADPDNNKISGSSPVGQGLMGHKVNDIVEIKIPRGIVSYKIMKIEKGDK
ncbi:MAG: transcription elongation factor GreA [Caldisericaceae bacterium]